MMIEDANTDGLKKNVIEELNKLPWDDSMIFDNTSKSVIKKTFYIKPCSR